MVGTDRLPRRGGGPFSARRQDLPFAAAK